MSSLSQPVFTCSKVKRKALEARVDMLTNPMNQIILRVIPVPAGIYLLKVNKRNTRASCEICSKLTIKILLERRQALENVYNLY